MFSGFIHAVTYIRVSILFNDKNSSTVCISTFWLSIHSSMDTVLLPPLAPVNNTAINMGVQISL